MSVKAFLIGQPMQNMGDLTNWPRFYVCDTYAERPSSMVVGSIMFCAENGKQYRATASNAWAETGGGTGGAVAAGDITNATATGVALMTAADAAAARTAISASSLALGTTGTTACAGDDSRLSDARTPTAHSHALTSASAFATATTSISTATYADITGCSVSLAAGTWLIMGQVNIMAANAIVQAFVAITHSDNTVISEVAASRPASGTASLNSPFSCNPIGIVSPGSTTTYKLRGARGLTTHTGSWTAMDGNGVNTTNHASNNSDKGSAIFAVKIA